MSKEARKKGVSKGNLKLHIIIYNLLPEKVWKSPRKRVNWEPLYFCCKPLQYKDVPAKQPGFQFQTSPARFFFSVAVCHLLLNQPLGIPSVPTVTASWAVTPTPTLPPPVSAS